MVAHPSRLGFVLIGFYCWSVTVFLGMVLLDILYSNLVPEAAAAFADISDLLLLMSFAPLLAACAAIAFSWKSIAARNLFIASLLVLFGEFLGPGLFFQFLQNTQELNIGPWLRLIPSGSASILAFTGLFKYLRSS